MKDTFEAAVDAKQLKQRIEMSGIEHVTLHTGQRRISRRGEVPAWGYEHFRSVFPSDGESHSVVMPFFDATHILHIRRSGTSLLTTVAQRNDGTSIGTIGIGLRPDSSKRTWRFLHQIAELPSITRPGDVPVRPWVAAELGMGYANSSVGFILALATSMGLTNRPAARRWRCMCSKTMTGASSR